MAINFPIYNTRKSFYQIVMFLTKLKTLLDANDFSHIKELYEKYPLVRISIRRAIVFLIMPDARRNNVPEETT
jgi:hypothetical protein